MDKNIFFLPVQTTGKQVDLDYAVRADSPTAASAIFKKAKSLLLQPHLWQSLAGAATAGFALGTPNATSLLLKEGDFVNIDIPGPGGKLGGGLDWTQVKAINENVLPGTSESWGITLAASNNPETGSADTAHFFEQISTSSFLLQRTADEVKISYHGRNEVPNRHTGSTLDNIRNTLVAAGAAAGLSEVQWTALIKGVLDAAAGGMHD